MSRKTRMVFLSKDWDYEELTDKATKMFKEVQTRHIFHLEKMIVYFSALEACSEDTVPKGPYPISGAILIDLKEFYDIPQWELALALGVDRNVILRRVKKERETRQQAGES